MAKSRARWAGSQRELLEIVEPHIIDVESLKYGNEFSKAMVQSKNIMKLKDQFKIQLKHVRTL